MLLTETIKFVRIRLPFFIIMTFFLSGATSGWSQGFMVKPMKITLAARPGQEVTQVLELRNTLPTETPISLEIAKVDLKQGDNASWIPVESSASEPPAVGPRSCLPWMSIDYQSLDIKPLTSGKVLVKVKVPSGARGTYAAGITAQTKDNPNVKGLRMVIRFLIPVIVQIQGPPAQRKAEILDTKLASITKVDAESSQTIVSMDVVNSGENISRLKPQVQISRQEANRWRPVLTEKFEEKPLLPAQTVRFSYDTKRNFPSGKYQIIASLTMDEQPVKPLTREIDFQGDPSAKPLASNVALILDPARIESDIVPGARRTAQVTLRNPTDEPLTISGGIEQPDALKGVMLGQIKGSDLVADKWVTVSPAQFSLPKNSERKIAVQLAYPKDLSKPAYYATLNLTATHPDGQAAGSMKALIIAQNKKAASLPRMYGQNLSVVQADGNLYTVSAVFANVGGVHLDPSCKGYLLAGSRLSAVKEFSMERDPGLILPLGVPSFNGILDLTGIQPGGYVLKLSCEFAGGKPGTQSVPVKVTDQNGQKMLEIIGEVTKE